MTDQPTKQQCLNQVLANLKQGLDRKLQGQRDAVTHLENAYELACDPDPLDAPWPQVTAYRLAHLLMREGLKTDWQRVDDLLRKAGEDDVLGPVPLIYRLIALSKLNAEDTPSAEMKRVYARARETLDEGDHAGASTQRQVGDQGSLQPELLNLLEAVVYTTGLEYDRIAGWAGPDLFAGLGFKSSGWRVIEDKASANLLYPEAIARKVFAQRRERVRDGLVFEVVTARRISSVRLRMGAAPVDGLLEAPATWRLRATWDLISLVCGERRYLHLDSESKDGHAAIRQRKNRLRQYLLGLVPELTDEALNEWWEKPGADRQPPDLPPIILLVGPEAWDDIEKRGWRIRR